MLIRKIQNIYINKFVGARDISGKSKNIDDLLKKYRLFVESCLEIEYRVNFKHIDDTDFNHQWVGGIWVENCFYAIPNDMTALLCLDVRNDKVSHYGRLKPDIFKWTGGTVYNGSIYAFPRKNNTLLKMELKTKDCLMIKSNFNYEKEHHYGGVCTVKGEVFQPPRNSDHILFWNLNNDTCQKIYLTPKWLHAKLRYCGSVVHPNGYIYFLPENSNKVIKMNQETREWCFIGAPINAMVFDAKVGIDGNIYGFSAYNRGLIKINVSNDEVSMIHQEISTGAYGTKLGINGKLYSIPGDGSVIWEYDIINDQLKEIYDLNNFSKAKFAGGSISNDGIIYGTPATVNQIIILVPNIKREIPDVLYNTFFCDCY